MKDLFDGGSSTRFSGKIVPPMEARRILEESGLTRAEGIGWVPTALYEKSIKSGLLVNRNGWHSFAVPEIEEVRVLGHRGRTPITKSQKKKDIQAINRFFEEKEEQELLLNNPALQSLFSEEVGSS